MRNATAPKPEKPIPKTTYSPEYIEDRKKIDTLAKSIQNQIGQLNKHLTIIQVTDFKLNLNEPTIIAKKHKKWWQFWK